MKLEVRIKKKLGKFLLDVAFESDGALDGRVLFDSEKHINLSPQERKVGYLFRDYAL